MRKIITNKIEYKIIYSKQLNHSFFEMLLKKVTNLLERMNLYFNSPKKNFIKLCIKYSINIHLYKNPSDICSNKLSLNMRLSF
jgi:hypothetical protein